LNLATLGISIKDSEFIDIETYFEIVDLHLKTIDYDNQSRRATQSDIDKFLL